MINLKSLLNCSTFIYKTYISQYSGSQFTSKFDNYNVGKIWNCDIIAAKFSAFLLIFFLQNILDR